MTKMTTSLLAAAVLFAVIQIQSTFGNQQGKLQPRVLHRGRPLVLHECFEPFDLAYS